MWCDHPPEDRVISIVAGCLANHDRAHSLDGYLTLSTKVVHFAETQYAYGWATGFKTDLTQAIQSN